MDNFDFGIWYILIMTERIIAPILFLIVVTITFGTIYGVGQQILRQSANDPQIQIVEDLVVKLNAGNPPTVPSLQEGVDIRNSLAPFFIVFDANGKPTTASGMLDGKIPEPPHGVFDYVAKYGQDRVTWQPDRNVRIAAVIDKTSTGFVLGGKSLREVELREDKLATIVAAGWLMSILFVCAYGVIHFKQYRLR